MLVKWGALRLNDLMYRPIKITITASLSTSTRFTFQILQEP